MLSMLFTPVPITTPERYRYLNAALQLKYGQRRLILDVGHFGTHNPSPPVVSARPPGRRPAYERPHL